VNGGGAYVFDKVGTSWTETVKLTSSDMIFTDFFGGAVHLDGDTAVVGALNHTHSGLPSNAGSAYVFEYAGTSWSEQAELLASDSAAFDWFGNAVHVDDDTAVVGAYHHSAAGTYSGAAYLYVYRNATWSEQSKITATGLSTGDQFGYAVTYDDDLALIGTPGDDDVASNSGTADAWVRTAPASAIFRNDAGGANPLGYLADPPVLGTTWFASVDNTGTSNTLAWVVGYLNALEFYMPQANQYLLVDVWSPGGELLQLGMKAGTGVVNWSINIPNDPIYLGVTLATQGAGFGGVDGTVLRNAYDLFVGY